MNTTVRSRRSLARSGFSPAAAVLAALATLASAAVSAQPAVPRSAPVVAQPAVPRVAVKADDPFQRTLTFYNDSPVTIWPVFQSPQDSNCQFRLVDATLFRIHVNDGVKDAGIAPTRSVKVSLPKTWPCATGGFYNAVRIFIFTMSPVKFEEELKTAFQVNQVTTPYNTGLTTPICGPDLAHDPCWTGYAGSAYALDAPAQLLEYTIISQDSLGKAYVDPNDPRGVPFLDFDVSYVDEAYLPAAMAADSGAIQYMGSSLSFDDFRMRLTDFTAQTKWPQYAAFAPLNFNATDPKNRTVFAADLIANNAGAYPRVPSGAQAVAGSFKGDGSSLYKPSWDGVYPRVCVDPLGKANVRCSIDLPLNQFCCPDTIAMQGCCDAKNYIIDKVGAQYNKVTDKYHFTGEVLRDLTSRFTKWTNTFDCASGTPASPVVDQVGFCNAFKKTVRFAWKAFQAQDAAGAKECSPLVRNQERYDECLTATLIGYRIDTTHAVDFAEMCKTCPNAPCPQACLVEKQLNESVQALLRGVPWTSQGPPAECGPNVCPSEDGTVCSASKCIFVKTENTAPDAKLYHFDKYLHFWAPYDSVYNLDPYARAIHDPGALSAPGAYSFSIDDFYGNFGGPGTNLLVDVGSTKRLPNPEPFDPYKQYFVTVGPGWDHMKLCGRTVTIPKDQATGLGIPLGTPVSFYGPDGARRDPCLVEVFSDAAETKAVRYQLSEVTYNVVDTYTNKTQTVKGLSGVAATRIGNEPGVNNLFCTSDNHSDADLIAKGKCTGNLSAVGFGNRNAFNSVPNNCINRDDAKCGRPMISLAVPALF